MKSLQIQEVFFIHVQSVEGVLDQCVDKCVSKVLKKERICDSKPWRSISILKDGTSHLVTFNTLFNSNQSLLSNIFLPLPSMLVDNEEHSPSGTISEVNVEGGGGGVIDLTLEASNPCEV